MGLQTNANRLAAALGQRKSVLLAVLLLLYLPVAAYSFQSNFILITAPLLGIPLLLLAAADIRYLWYAAVALMPLSINLEQFVAGVGLNVPSDLLAVGLTLLLVVKSRQLAPTLNRTLAHPISLVLLAYLFWMLLSGIQSSMPVVSAKYVGATFFYFLSFFVLATVLFQNPREWYRWIALAAFGLIVAGGNTMVKHAMKGFTLEASYFIMQPFYKEHTAYAASLAVYTIAAFLLGVHHAKTASARAGWFGLTAFLVAAILTSYTRGAYVGLFAAGIFYLILITWKRYRGLVLVGLALAAVGVAVNVQVYRINQSEQNKDSQNMFERLYSSLNVKTDISNMERINRWIAAYYMIEQRPVFGFGPGSYTKQYAPFQRERYMTPISTRQGTMGSTHNELLLAASELGLPAMGLVLLLYLVSVVVAVRGFFTAPNPHVRLAYLVAITGLITYYVHGLVNNFMDQDKVNIPVYSCLALLVALDVFHRKTPPEPSGNSSAHALPPSK